MLWEWNVGPWAGRTRKDKQKSGVNPRRLHRKQQANESEPDEDIEITSWWLNQPIWKICVKLDTFPKVRGENKKYLSCHHLDKNGTPSGGPHTSYDTTTWALLDRFSSSPLESFATLLQVYEGILVLFTRVFFVRAGSVLGSQGGYIHGIYMVYILGIYTWYILRWATKTNKNNSNSDTFGWHPGGWMTGSLFDSFME